MSDDESDDFLRSIRDKPLRYVARASRHGTRFLVVDTQAYSKITSHHRSSAEAIRRAMEMNAKEEKGDA